MNVVIVQYKVGNIQSVVYALERVGVTPIVSNNPGEIMAADKVIFPGVGAAGTAMEQLENTGLDDVIKQLKQPVLGICLGMQLLCNYSEEDDTKCLGIINTDVRKFVGHEKIPHIGWNQVYDAGTALYDDLGRSENMYFVHSFYAPVCDFTISKTHYIEEYSSALQCRNFYGVQFHPEKSGDAGERLLKNFIDL